MQDIEQDNEKLDLWEFANQYQMRGEQVVAVEYLWRMNDAYYGQWLLLNYPFRDTTVFQVAAIIERVPARYRWFATALVMTDTLNAGPLQGYWRDPRRLVEDMELEGHTDKMIEDITCFVQGCVQAIAYLDGRLNLAEEQAGNLQAVPGTAADRQPVQFRGKQLQLLQGVKDRVATALAGKDPQNDHAWDNARSDASARAHRPVVCRGKPGTGKTTVLQENIRLALADGARVLMAFPTARMVTRMKAQSLGNKVT